MLVVARYKKQNIHNKLNANRLILGYTLLEFALAFSFTIPILIASLDLTKLFQARSTVKAAVDTTLRCITATDDPSCSIAQALDLKPIYRVRMTRGLREFPLVHYDGEVSYIEAATYEVGPFRARVLDKGFAEISGVAELKGEVELHYLTAEVRYNQISQQLLPQILATSLSSREPIFQSGFTTISIPGSITTASASLPSGKALVSQISPSASLSGEFTIPLDYSRSNCIGGMSYPSEMRKNAYDCFATNSAGQPYIRGILQVKGSGWGNSNKVCGKALLELQMQDENGQWSTAYNLSGQSFQGKGGNFIPRGYNNNSVEVSLVNNIIPNYYNGEDGKKVLSEAFQGEIRFILGKKYRVAVRTQVDTRLDDWNKTMSSCDNGEIFYKISESLVYIPKIESNTKTVRCAEKSDNCETPKICTEDKIPQVLSKRLDPNLFSKILITEPKIIAEIAEIKSINCGVDVLSQKNFQEISRDNTRSAAGSCSCERIKLRQEPINKTIQVAEVDCPENKGVSDGFFSELKISNSSQAQQLCPVYIKLEKTSLDEDQVKRSWRTKEILVENVKKVVPKNCYELTEQSLAQTAWKTYFPEYLMPITEDIKISKTLENSLIEAGRESASFPEVDTRDPEHLIHTAEFACGSFVAKKLKISELKKKTEFKDNTTIFESKSPLLNCLGGSNTNNWKQILAEDLRKNYSRVENAFFRASYMSSSSTISSNCDMKIEDSSLLPSNKCIPYSTLDPSTTSSFIVSNKSDGRTLPLECSNSCAQCSFELEDLSIIEKPKIEILRDRAIAKGRKELQAFSPWLSRDCGEIDCARLTFEDLGDRAKINAAIKIPLFSKSIIDLIFGNKIFGEKSYFELQYSSIKTYEREFARG